MRKHYYAFQESYIWDGASDSADPQGAQVKVRADSEAAARTRLARQKKYPALGRRWVLIKEEQK